MILQINTLLHESLLLEREAMRLIARAHLNTSCDERLGKAFRSALSHLGRSGVIVRDLENYLRNRFKKEFEPFYSEFFEDLDKDAPTVMRASEKRGTYER